MSRPDGGRPGPASPWRLSAPESLVLREGASGQGVPALKLVVLELVGRRVLRVESEPRWWGRRTWVAPGGAAPPATGPLAGLARTCLQQAAGGRARLDKVVARHLKDHGRSAERWLEDEVLPALQARGLLDREQRRTLAVFTRTTWRRTAAGDGAAADLEGRLEELRRAVRSTTDPRDALALVAATGAAVLLADDAWPLVGDLRRRVADGGGNGAGTTGGDVGDVDGLGDGGLDLGELDLDLGAIGDSVDAVDAGVDAGGADGGGGDGGGGGD
jgi:hypothetical protein